jgi:hypothetical protein
MALHVQDTSFWVNANGQVGPNLPGFSNTASWNDTGFDQRIVDFWLAIFGARARSATAAATLQVSINVGDALEAAAIYLGVAGVAAFVAAEAIIGPNGTGWHCDPATPVPGPGINVEWRCYPNPPR